jgi:hypothetical protein
MDSFGGSAGVIPVEFGPFAKESSPQARTAYPRDSTGRGDVRPRISPRQAPRARAMEPQRGTMTHATPRSVLVSALALRVALVAAISVRRKRRCR